MPKSSCARTLYSTLLLFLNICTHKPYVSGLASQNPWLPYKTTGSLVTCWKYGRLLANFRSVLLLHKIFGQSLDKFSRIFSSQSVFVKQIFRNNKRLQEYRTSIYGSKILDKTEKSFVFVTFNVKAFIATAFKSNKNYSLNSSQKIPKIFSW